MEIDYGQIKQGQRAMWSSGDFPDIAKTIQPVSDALVEAMGIQEGQDVLDVATGSGNAAIPAAQIGARVTGLDLTPELFDAARARAAEAGVEVEWVEGDAEELPFADGSELWGGAAELSFQTLTVPVEAESPEAWVDYCEETLGPVIMAKRALEPEGRWEALRSDLLAHYTEHNEATDGTLHAPAEYLRTLGRLPT